MRKVKEVLRLRAETTLSGRAIGRAIGVSPASVTEYLARARAALLSWPLPPELDDDALERRLFPPLDGPSPARVLPDWSHVHREMRRPSVTLLLLWEEYKGPRGEEGYNYSRFCSLYREWVGRVDVTMRQHHVAGEKLFVDYAGDRLYVSDPGTGERRLVQLFVAVLGASNYTYAEASWTQDALDWAGAHMRAFAFFGGVPTLVVPDNLKSGVTRACRFDPDLNPTYHEMARHYGTTIIPARVRKPRDKAKAEVGVQVVQRWIAAVLRDRVFFTLHELNTAIRELLEGLNRRPFKKLDGSRLSAFEAVERAALRPLPAAGYELATWAKVRVGTDYHVSLEGHWYSVPYALAKQQVELRYTPTVVEVLHASRRVASHLRGRVVGGHTSLKEHMPPGHQAYLEWTPERLEAWALKKGEHVAAMARALLGGGDHALQGLKACQGLVSLDREFGPVRLDAACRRAIHFGTHSYTSVSRILRKELDREALPAAAVPAPAPLLPHENLRGSAYYVLEDAHA